MMCCFHVNLLSRVMSSYLFLLGAVILLMETCGQVCFSGLNVTLKIRLIDLSSKIFPLVFIESLKMWMSNVTGVRL